MIARLPIPSPSIVAWLKRRRLGICWGVALLVCLVWNDASFRKYDRGRDQAYIHGWDNNGYFAWGRSLALDGDIDFANDFTFIANLRGFGATQRAYADFMATNPRTRTGLVPNKYGMGLGVVALPFLLTAKLLSTAYAALTSREVSPFAPVYPVAFIFASILAGFAGLAVSFRVLRSGYGGRIAFWAVTTGFFGLSISYYVWFEPTMAHSAGFCFATLFAATALGWRKALEGDLEVPGRRWRLLGLAGLMGLVLGLACMIRYTNAVFALAPAVLCGGFLRSRENGALLPKARIVGASLWIAALGAFIGFLPQMLAWKAIYGSHFIYSYEGERLELAPRHLPQILFGLRNGLFVWTPLAGMAVAGLIVGALRGRAMAVAGLAVGGALVWIYGGWSEYGLGYSYGMRGLTEWSFFLFLGLAELIRLGGDKPSLRRAGFLRSALLRGVIVLLVLWNAYLVVSYRADLQPHGEPLAAGSLFSNWARWIRQLKNDAYLHKKLGNRKFPLFTSAPPLPSPP